MTKGKQKDKQKSTGGWFYSIFNVQPESGAYCTPDQCFVNNQQAFSTTSLISSITPEHTEHSFDFNNSSSTTNFSDSTYLSELLPPELIQLITDAAQQGLLISMLITLVNEGATDYLKNLHYHPDRIYWINQSIRALLLMAMGSSAIVSIATPLAGYVLHSYGGYSKEQSNYISTGIALGLNLLTNPLSLTETSITIGTSVSASFLGSKITRAGYHLMRHAFFGNAEAERTIHENELRPLAKLS
ncbi:hypothetical protein [Fluoribacter gormanii]|uniref:Uncharacterized protein n=1 Tax=Fluoribacter gormanii TaxID=464 RepID=A0A377GHL2_9GAMM|nr:hypothetical protein [Fluoribacter gormanii]KTD01290.1 hypothetical protein Lgor_2356 [Fluoribacter gormanii]SIR81082.1 hypothetical protein SAMN05421777_12612 [Fluoribacter gormanii]STO24319.1 Uncharacterised protein [Fluoribacter gormanii]